MAGLETFCWFIGYPPLLFWTTDDITLLTSFHAGLPKGHDQLTDHIERKRRHHHVF
jgi:hypothetical protein